MSARIYLADGSPAAGATVRVYPVDQKPTGAVPKATASQGPIFFTKTDAKGRYSIDSLPRGEYNILSEKDGDVAYQDSVFISGNSGKVALDTLHDAGSLTGHIVLQSHHDPLSVTVELLGTNVFANVDDSGRFTLAGLAGGSYRARAVTTYAEYTPTFANVKATSGRADTLPAPIVLTYTGIPVVGPIAASYDTLRGGVRLVWKPVGYRNFRDYVVYESPENPPFSITMIGETRDTALTYLAGEGMGGIDPRLTRMREYRVALRSKTLEVGPLFASAVVDIVSASEVITALSVAVVGTIDNQASIHDTVRFILAYDNPTRRNREIRWNVSGHAAPVRRVTIDAPGGKDTLAWRWDDVGNPSVTVTVLDEGGNERSETLSLYIVQDPPVPLPDPDMAFGALEGDTIRVRASDTDRFGRIVKWEWDFGCKGTFVPSAGPDTLFKVPAGPAAYQIAVRVTDDDGNTPVDTISVFPIAWPKMVSLPAGSFRRFDGKTFQVANLKVQATEVERALFQKVMGKDETPGPWEAGAPASMVTIYDAMDFCNKLSAMQGLPLAYVSPTPFSIKPRKGGYRLPTAEEWEYAARGGRIGAGWQNQDPDSPRRYDLVFGERGWPPPSSGPEAGQCLRPV